MNWVLFVTIILGGVPHQQPVQFFNSEKECKQFLPKDQELKQNLQIVGKCHEIIGEVDEQ